MGEEKSHKVSLVPLPAIRVYVVADRVSRGPIDLPPSFGPAIVRLPLRL